MNCERCEKLETALEEIVVHNPEVHKFYYQAYYELKKTAEAALQPQEQERSCQTCKFEGKNRLSCVCCKRNSVEIDNWQPKEGV